MSKPAIAAQLYTLRKHLQTAEDIAETLKKVKDIGYTEVQISGFGPVAPAETAQIIRDTGINVCATHVQWERFLNELDAVIEEHKMWNCKHAAVGAVPSKYRSAEGLSQFLEELKPVSERLAAEGMDFSYHNHNHELVRINGKTWLETLYDRADPGMLKAEIDTYWIQAGGGDPAEWIRQCSGREPLLHLKDMCVTADREQRFAEIGEGNLNWPAILDAAENGGVEYLLIEQDDCYDRSPFESLEISYKNLKKMQG